MTKRRCTCAELLMAWVLMGSCQKDLVYGPVEGILLSYTVPETAEYDASITTGTVLSVHFF